MSTSKRIFVDLPAVEDSGVISCPECSAEYRGVALDVTRSENGWVEIHQCDECSGVFAIEIEEATE